MTRTDDIKACQRIFGAKPDGDFGKQSEDAMIGYFRAKGLLNNAVAIRFEPSLTRARIVERALGELGDANPDKYWREVCPAFVGQPHKIAWCGGFSLWVYVQEVPACKDWTWQPGRGYALPRGMRMVSLPEPGDLVYWEYVNGVKLDHYAIVRDVKDGIVYSIDGNQGISPRERVEERDRSVVHTKPVFFSIGAFL